MDPNAPLYTITAEDIQKYDGYFAILDPEGRGVVTHSQCAPLFQKALLPEDVLGGVLRLADADNDGMLGKRDFRIAMHLLQNSVKGIPVPASIPAPLAMSSWGMEVGSGVDGSFLAPTAMAPAAHAAVGFAGGGIPSDELWRYRSVFQQHEPVAGVSSRRISNLVARSEGGWR